LVPDLTRPLSIANVSYSVVAMADAGDWEVAVSKKNKVPTPVARMSALRNHLIPKDIHLSTPKEIVLKPMKERKSDMTVLAQLLGFIPIDDIPGSARELFRHAILICLDLEHWSYNSNKTTEVGLVIYDMHDITPIVHSKQLGDHGEELLKCGKHHFFRIAQHAHLEKGNDEILGPEGNVFGKCRFTELEELRDILKKCFVQPLVGVPQHEGCHRPIVVLGHDGKHDWENLMDKAVSTNLVEYGTVVRFIDTQELHRSTGDWDEVYNRVGLRTLIHFFDFEHEQGHTAANDASRTAICAFQAVLRLGAKNCDDCWNAKNDCIKTSSRWRTISRRTASPRTTKLVEAPCTASSAQAITTWLSNARRLTFTATTAKPRDANRRAPTSHATAKPCSMPRVPPVGLSSRGKRRRNARRRDVRARRSPRPLGLSSLGRDGAVGTSPEQCCDLHDGFRSRVESG
jgi:hypothetical protein